MFDYDFATNAVASAEPSAETVWSHAALSALAPDVLTPFSYSMMAEILRRGWYTHYDGLGFEPTPGARLLRQHRGRAYVNLTISARLEAQAAAVEPLALRINGEPHPVAAWDKPSLLAGLRMGRQQRKINAALDEYAARMASITQRARDWDQKTQTLRWSQAEILQVMEEIERVGVESLAAFFAARHNLELLYHRLLWATQAQAPYPQNLAHLQHVVRTVEGCVEGEMAAAVADLAALLREHAVDVADLRARLHTAGDDVTAREPLLADLPADVQSQLDAFFQRYGHRGIAESEIRRPRHSEDPTSVWAGMLVAAQQPADATAPLSFDQAAQQILTHVDAGQQKAARQWLEQIPRLVQLQSRALHAFAHVRMGTRRWALAAAREAMTDQRFTAQDDVFFFELEEVKEMMTGEWNVSALEEIQAEAQQRRQRYAKWQACAAGALLLGDAESAVPERGKPGAPGQASGAYWPVAMTDPATEPPPIGGIAPLDSGGAVLVPGVAGLVGAGATPLDPIAAVAAAWERPCVLISNAQLRKLQSGAAISIDGSAGTFTA